MANFEDILNKLIRYAFMEQVAHGVHEYDLWLLPPQRKIQRVSVHRQPKSLRIVGLGFPEDLAVR